MDGLNYHYKYPHPSVTTDCVVFGYDGFRLNVLLVERGREPHKGKWAFPGGFLEIDEAAEDGALRELYEETGLSSVDLRQFHSFTEPGRDPRERVISIAYYALVSMRDVCGGDDAAAARWFALDSVPPLAFDHDKMLATAVEALRRRALLEPIGREVLQREFCIDDLRQLYEAVLGMKVNAEKFESYVVGCGWIEPVGADASECPYRFCKNTSLGVLPLIRSDMAG